MKNNIVEVSFLSFLYKNLYNILNFDSWTTILKYLLSGSLHETMLLSVVKEVFFFFLKQALYVAQNGLAFSIFLQTTGFQGWR